MESLIYTPTNILAKVHGENTFSLSSRSSSSSSSTLSWRREICLSKSLNAHFHSLRSSNSEVHSTSEGAKPKIPQKDVVSLRLELRKECQFGEQFLVVGDDPILGSWEPLDAAPLNWSDGHTWTLDLELPVGKTIHYKFICKLSTGDIVWQPGFDRTIRLTERQNIVIVIEDWENVEAEKIIKQEKPTVDDPETKSSDPFGCLSIPNEKLITTTKNSFNTSESTITACTGDGVTHRNEENLGARDHTDSTNKIKDDKNEEESLFIYDEVCVLVPGMTLQVITEESLAKELKKTILSSSSFTAQVMTEEALGKDMQLIQFDDEDRS